MAEALNRLYALITYQDLGVAWPILETAWSLSTHPDSSMFFWFPWVSWFEIATAKDIF